MPWPSAGFYTLLVDGLRVIMSDLGQLESDTGVRWIAISNNGFGTTSYLYPTSTPRVAVTANVLPEAAAMDFFVKYKSVFQMVDPAHELTPESSGSASGLEFASFTQK